MYLFSWGAFLRDYLERKIFSQSLCLSVCGASWGIIAIIIALADWNNRVGTFIGYIDWFTFANLYSVFSLICALSLFVFFKQMQIGYKPWINKFAAAMFGVYLIHENPIVYPWLWSKVFHVPEYLGSSWFILYALAVITIVFFICAILDLIWEKVLQSGYQKYLFPRLQPLDKRVTDFLKCSGEPK